jgi:hypothetical protein
VRQQLARHGFAKTEEFRWRGHEILRIEAFSDAVFAFAITLLVVSLEVPKTFNELMESMQGFAGFAAAFAILFIIWLNQYKFFRRYGMQDQPTLWLNALLLFLILFFVYPLKFLFSFLFHVLATGKNEVRLPGGEIANIVMPGQENQLMTIYAAGYAAVFAVFLLLYLRAYGKREALELTPVETSQTLASIREMGLQIAIGLVSLSFALVGKAGWSGFTYCLIGPVLTIHGMWSRHRHRKIAAGLQRVPD